MVDVHSKEQRSYNMSQIKCKETTPELKVKKILEKRGFFYQPDIYGKPDFINYKKRIVIFIDGCFWHKCPKCFKMPQTNKKFWKKKILSNVLRDKEVSINYIKSGWNVLRFWEHEIKTRKFINLRSYDYL